MSPFLCYHRVLILHRHQPLSLCVFLFCNPRVSVQPICLLVCPCVSSCMCDGRINSCVGQANHRSFLLTLILFLLTSLYGIGLVLRSVCPQQHLLTAMLYCPGVYNQFRYWEHSALTYSPQPPKYINKLLLHDINSIGHKNSKLISCFNDRKKWYIQICFKLSLKSIIFEKRLFYYLEPFFSYCGFLVHPCFLLILSHSPVAT